MANYLYSHLVWCLSSVQKNLICSQLFIRKVSYFTLTTKHDDKIVQFLSKCHDGWPSSMRTQFTLFSPTILYSVFIHNTWPLVSWSSLTPGIAVTQHRPRLLLTPAGDVSKFKTKTRSHLILKVRLHIQPYLYTTSPLHCVPVNILTNILSMTRVICNVRQCTRSILFNYK